MEFEDVRIQMDDRTALRVRRHDGDSAPLLLLHDLDCSGNYWDAVIERLLELDPDLHILSLDLRGHGASSCHGDTSRKRLLKDLRTVCKSLRVEYPVLCGHGWGADIALASEIGGSVIAVNPLLGRPSVEFPDDAQRPAALRGAISSEVLAACERGAQQAKRLRRSAKDAPLLLIAADPADTAADGYDAIAEMATEVYAWQDASRHLPQEVPAGVAALVLAWIEEVA